MASRINFACLTDTRSDPRRDIRLSFGLLLVAGLAAAQDNRQQAQLLDFSGGLNVWQQGLYLRDSESPDLQNVILDKSGGVTRRRGFRRLNSTVIGDGDDDVNAIFQLEQSDGDRYCVAFSSTSGYSSTDGCATFTSFISTLTRGNDVSCDAMQDRLYCVNDQYNFFFDGSNDLTAAQMPAALDFIRAHRDRCYAAGATGNLSRLFYSAPGDCATWAPSVDFVDVAPDDGDVISGIGPPLFDALPIYKKFSTWLLKGVPGRFSLVSVSKDTGAVNHRAVRNFQNRQLFDSVGPNGGRPGIYALNGIVVEEVSQKLRNEIEQLDTFKANRGFQSIDSKKDWDAGTFDIFALSSARDAGFMQSSYTALTDTLGLHFASGTLVNVTTSVAGALTLLAYGSNTFVNAGGETDASTNWTTQDWQRSEGTNLYGTIEWTFSGLGVCICNDFFRVRLEDESNNPLTDNYYRLFNGMGTPEFTIEVSTLNARRLIFRGTMTCGGALRTGLSLPFLKPQRLKFKMRDAESGDDCGANWDLDETGPYTTSGTFTSRAFDLSISTPVFGLFEVDLTSNAQSGLVFETQTATSSAGLWGGVAIGTLGSEIASASRRYVRYLSSFTINSATNTPAQLTEVRVAAASTGNWVSAELFLSNNITAGGWGLFQTAQNVSGSEAAVSYAVRTATFSGGTRYQPYVSITPGSTITNSTGAYVQVTSTFTVGVATETSRADSITLTWTEGAQATSATAEVFDGRYHYGAQSRDGRRNDVMYILDSRGAWIRWRGVRPRYLNIVNKNFVMGDSSTTSAGYVFNLYDTDSDDTEPISAYWESRDLSLGGLHKIKSVDRVYTVHSASDTIVTATLKADGGLRSQTYSLNFSTGIAFGILPRVIAPPLNGNSFRLRVGNESLSKPWEVLGFLIYYRELGLMP